MAKIQINLPPKLVPVFLGDRRIRGAHGGRGSAKTRSFAKMSAIRGYMAAESGKSGIILCGREWMNSLTDSSMAEVKNAIESETWLKNYYEVGEKYIRTKNKKVEYVFAGLNRNLESIKSKALILLAWIDEAEGVSEIGWNTLEPSIREDGSELWVTWNPQKDGSPTDIRFRKEADSLEHNSMVVELNYLDNPWFPKPMEELRKRQQKRLDPATYAWIWEGAYLQNSDAQVLSGKFRVDDFTPGPDWDGPYFGLDFGFAQDPTAGVKMWIHNSRLFFEHEAYANGLELDHTPKRLIQDLPGIVEHVCRADNSRPESISYLKRHGLPRMRACVKGKGSVEDGIAHLKSYEEIIIHPRCKNVLSECLDYSYKVDRLSGDVLPVLVDANNHCLKKGTMVEVCGGHKAIEDVEKGDRVLTRDGYKQVEWSGKSDSNRLVYSVKTESGAEIFGTENHKIYTNRGFLRIDEIRYTDYVLRNKESVSWDQKLQRMMEKSFAGILNQKDGVTENILSQHSLGISTGSCGRSILDRYLKGFMSIMSMETCRTTISRISNCCHAKNMRRGMSSQRKDLSVKRFFSIKPEKKPQNGTKARKAEIGILSTQKKHIRIGCRLKRIVTNVAKNTTTLIAVTNLDFAQMLANQHSGDLPGVMTKKELASFVEMNSWLTNTQRHRLVPDRVVAVTPMQIESDVYDITVEGQHEFFANGLLVHNCIDAARYGLEPVMKSRGKGIFR